MSSNLPPGVSGTEDYFEDCEDYELYLWKGLAVIRDKVVNCCRCKECDNCYEERRLVKLLKEFFEVKP